jgi:hypothetical protein
MVLSTAEYIKKMWYRCNSILLNNKEEWNYVIYRKTDGNEDHNVKWWSNPEKKYHVFSNMKNL